MPKDNIKSPALLDAAKRAGIPPEALYDEFMQGQRGLFSLGGGHHKTGNSYAPSQRGLFGLGGGHHNHFKGGNSYAPSQRGLFGFGGGHRGKKAYQPNVKHTFASPSQSRCDQPKKPTAHKPALSINRSTGAVNYIGLGNQKETYSGFIDEFKQFADDARKALNALNLDDVDNNDKYTERLETISKIRNALSRYGASLNQIGGQNTHPASLINGLRAKVRELSKVALMKQFELGNISEERSLSSSSIFEG